MSGNKGFAPNVVAEDKTRGLTVEKVLVALQRKLCWQNNSMGRSAIQGSLWKESML